ncbi:MAG TPA: sialate O-acetylesterase, partial [Verrucomicrobiae bacterium]
MKIHNAFARSLCVFTLLIFGSITTRADNAPLPLVSPIFGDHMVLQRGKRNAIWGWAKPGSTIRVEIAGKIASAMTGADGRWEAKIEPLAAGGPYTIKIEGEETVELQDVLVGDVWLCGGQSNMELGLARTRNGEEEIKAADHPQIRLYKVKSHPAYSPAEVPQGTWKVCSPETVAADGGFSAVGYFFGCRVQQDIHVPIGLVEDCLGGTPAETWTSPETLHRLKDFDEQLAEVDRLKAKGGPQYGNYIMHWYDDFDAGSKENWAAPSFDDSGWQTVTIPGGFQDLGVADVPSVCWFRKEINLPDPLPPGESTIFLGVIEKMDTTCVNGQWVGASSWVENPRVYHIKEGILKPGRNLVTIRVFKLKPNGGFMTDGAKLRLTLADGTDIPLAGPWKGKVSVDARPPHPLPLGFENYPIMPSVLYEGMIEPLAPMGLTGVIWYQGEANADRAYQYRKLLPAMIGDWRNLFGQGDIPFYIVSLPAFMHHQAQPVDSNWAELREAQAMTAQKVHNAGLAVTIDTGDPDNIHPPDKKIVGERLAYLALARNYGKKIPYAGPTFKSFHHLPGELLLRFDYADGGLVAKGEKLEEFAVAGKDHKWHWADASIVGDEVLVSSLDV